MFDVMLNKPQPSSNYHKGETGETNVTIYEQEYQDYQSKSKFVGYYIPMSPYTYKICEYLSDFYKTTMNDFDSKAEIRFGRSTESEVTRSQDLVFTNRIYIYHSDNLTLQERAALDRLYQSKGLSVILRGTAYLNAIWDSINK